MMLREDRRCAPAGCDSCGEILDDGAMVLDDDSLIAMVDPEKP